MMLRPLAAALALAAATLATPASAQTHLGTLGATDTGFGVAFFRLFGWGSPLGAFTDYYTFNLADSGSAAGGTVTFDFGSLDLSLSKITLSGGTLAAPVVDTTPSQFNFTGLGTGSYQLAVSGRLDPQPGWIGVAQYSGNIHTVASPAPEPETIAMLIAGLGVIGAVARRRRQA